MWLFCLLDPGQIRYRAIYTHPNQIPGYASDAHLLAILHSVMEIESDKINIQVAF